MMKQSKTSVIKVFLTFTFVFVLASSSNAATEKVVNPEKQGQTLLAPAAELVQLLNNMSSMQASFEQIQTNEKGVQIGEKTIGSMMLERPGKFRWKTTKPLEQLIIVNKDKSYLYDADLEQVTIRKIDYNQPSNPAMLLSSPTKKLMASFEINKLPAEGKNSWFELKPKTQSGYQSIKIYFANGKLNKMQIADNLGQKSEIKFNNIKFNNKIPAKMFVFTPPKGTDVFEAN